MPSQSKKQHNLMAAVAHDPAFAKKVGIKQSVGKEFAQADKGKTFKRGGEVKQSKTGNVGVTAMGKVKTGAPSRDGIAEKGKTKGKQISMKSSPGTMRGGSKGMKKGGYC